MTPDQEQRLQHTAWSLDDSLGRIDYRLLREKIGSIGAGYHNIRNINSWDVPPANLQMGIGGFESMKDLIFHFAEVGFLSELEEIRGEIREHVSPESMPSVDGLVIDDDHLLGEMMSAARNFKGGQIDVPTLLRDHSGGELATIMVVPLGESMPHRDRLQNLDKKQRAGRVELAGIIMKLLAGGLTFSVNVGFAALSPAVFTTPTLTGGVVGFLGGIAVSSHTGLTTIGKSLQDLGKFIESH